MKKKSGRLKFALTLLLALVVLGAFVLGGYFVLDKVVVPKYFTSYGINGMDDLVVMMRTLYSLPKEKDIVNNGFSNTDLLTAKDKLSNKNYPVLEDGTFDFEGFNNGERGSGDLYLTDRELASILDKLLDSTEFSDILPNLNNIDTLNMNLLELSITPELLENGNIDTNNAHIKFVLKVDTTDMRLQMAQEMDIPVFLLNMIFPEVLYLTANYNVSIDNSQETAVWTTSNGTLSVNGSNDDQSELLLELIISFIFNTEDNMTIQKLVENFGHILDQSVELFGKIEFASNLSIGNQNGIYFLPVETE